MEEKFEQVSPDMIKELLEFKRQLSNMDIERQETEIQKMTEKLKKGNDEALQKALKEAFRVGSLTKKEYEKEWKGRYIDENGIDGFTSILYVYVFAPKDKNIKITTVSQKVLRDKEKIKKRFKIDVLSPKEALELMRVEYEDKG